MLSATIDSLPPKAGFRQVADSNGFPTFFSSQHVEDQVGLNVTSSNDQFTGKGMQNRMDGQAE